MKKLLVLALLITTTACQLQKKYPDAPCNASDKNCVTNPQSTHSTQAAITESATKQEETQQKVEPQPLKMQDSVVVCRSKQCAPANISMSREYIHNSLLQIFENNNKTTALICNASASTHTCLENYITLPITVGITPANMYIDSVKITDINIGKHNQSVDLLLNYNVTFNGQSPDCTTAKSIIYAKNANHIILEDTGYKCQMTSIGKTSIKTVFAIDYIDLDYGFIGGYYSIGLSGPAYGGGVGYMLIRLMNDAYPLSPNLIASSNFETIQAEAKAQKQPKVSKEANPQPQKKAQATKSEKKEEKTTDKKQEKPVEKKEEEIKEGSFKVFPLKRK